LGEKSVQVFFLKNLLVFIEGVRDHVKKKDLVSKRLCGFPTSCQEANQMLLKSIGGGSPLMS